MYLNDPYLLLGFSRLATDFFKKIRLYVIYIIINVILNKNQIIDW